MQMVQNAECQEHIWLAPLLACWCHFNNSFAHLRLLCWRLWPLQLHGGEELLACKVADRCKVKNFRLVVGGADKCEVGVRIGAIQDLNWLSDMPNKGEEIRHSVHWTGQFRCTTTGARPHNQIQGSPLVLTPHS